MRNAKIDSTHKEIVEALRKGGCGVQSLAPVGKGCPDLLVSRRGRWYVVEVKTKKGKLRETQERWHAQHGHSVYILRDAEDAVSFLQQT